MRAITAQIGIFFATIVALVVAMIVTTSSRVDAADAPPFVIIVNAQNPNVTLDRAFVSDAFLKKATRWPGGDVIKPVDLPPDSSTREKFSQDVLKRSVAAVKSYWQQIIFAGRDVPPPELPNDEDVVKYVQKHEGAIGYVSGGARLADTRVVTVRW